MTAVEWLVEQMIKCELLPKSIHPDSVLFHKAKGMEKEQAKKMYSEKDVLDLLVRINAWPTTFDGIEDIAEWFEQFKKK